MEVFIENLKKQPLVVESWDESLWALMIEKAVVGRDGCITFVLYDGTEIVKYNLVIGNLWKIKR